MGEMIKSNQMYEQFMCGEDTLKKKLKTEINRFIDLWNKNIT